jgi:hypothetical protein
MTLPTRRCEAASNFSKLLIITNKFSSTMLKGRSNYRCTLSTEYITKSLSCEEEIKQHVAKKCRGKKSITEA